MKIGIRGTGYIGLTEGLCLADLGNEVVCFDVDKNKVENLNKGIPTIYEEGLEDMLKRNLANGKIKFSNDPKESLVDLDVVFICVNTPEKDKQGEADLSYVKDAVETVAYNADVDKRFVLVIRSTVPVGTNKMIRKLIHKVNPHLNYLSCSNPEFSKQGTAIKDFMEPDRIIVGVDNDEAKNVMEELYKPITDKGFPIFFSNIETAEMIKYASNTFLSVKVAFINEIADLCEKTGANVTEIAKAMGMDKRISPYFLNAGPGIGGSCFPKDAIALYNMGRKNGLDLELIYSSTESNKKRKKRMADKIVTASHVKLKNKRVAILGLTFKANTDDTRYSPSLSIIRQLVKKGIEINAYDPMGIPKTKQMLEDKYLKHVKFFDNAYDCVTGTEAAVVVTEWKEFAELDFEKIYSLMNQKLVVDLRNLLDRNKIEKIGFKYDCVGNNS